MCKCGNTSVLGIVAYVCVVWQIGGKIINYCVLKEDHNNITVTYKFFLNYKIEFNIQL